MVGYFYAAALPYGVVVEVDIGAFVKAVVRGLLSRRGNVVVDVCEAIEFLEHSTLPRAFHVRLTVSTETPHPAVEASCQGEEAVGAASQMSDGPKWRSGAAKSDRQESLLAKGIRIARHCE
jgi:hypothetical protein